MKPLPLLLSLLASAGCARAAARAPRDIQPGVEFTLAIGEAAAWPPVRLRFVRVVDDGRCPRQTNCAATFPVSVEVEVTNGGSTTRETLETFGRDEQGPARSCAPLPKGTPALWLRDVEPWPVAGKKTPASAIRAIFAVTGSCGPSP
jgi:hypothetical protein